jgi:hypothetical protein
MLAAGYPGMENQILLAGANDFIDKPSAPVSCTGG